MTIRSVTNSKQLYWNIKKKKLSNGKIINELHRKIIAIDAIIYNQFNTKHGKPIHEIKKGRFYDKYE